MPILRKEVIEGQTTPALRIEERFEDDFIHVDLIHADVQQTTTAQETIHHVVLPGQCAGCRQSVSNQHTCDICKHNMHIFYGEPVGPPWFNQHYRYPSCQQGLEGV